MNTNTSVTKMEIMDKMEAAIDKGLNKKDLLHLFEIELQKAGIKTTSQIPSITGESTTSMSETVNLDSSGMLHDIFNQLTEYGVEMDTLVQTMKDYQVSIKTDLQLLIETQKRNMEQKWEEYSMKSQKQTQALLENFIETQSKAHSQNPQQQDILLALGKIQDDLEEHQFISTDAFRKETSALKKKISDLSESLETGFSVIKTNVLGLKDTTRLIEKNLQKYRQEIQLSNASSEFPGQNNIGGEDVCRKGPTPDKAPENALIPVPLNHMDILVESFYGFPYKAFVCPNLSLPTSLNCEEDSGICKPSTLFGIGLVVLSYLFLYWNAATTSSGGQTLWKKWFK